MSTSFGESKSPPKGWTVFNGVLTPDTTLAGYWARGREVRGICQTRDCRRSCHLDLERYVEKGLGRLALKDLLPLYRCQRLGGCAMQFKEDHGAVLSIGMLRRHPGVAVRFTCGKCRKTVIVPTEAAIGKLAAEGAGGPDTPVTELGRFAKAPCACGATSWTVEILWHDPDRVPAWLKRALDKA
jgi:hypothetical protein